MTRDTVCATRKAARESVVFIAIRAITYATLFIGVFLVYVPASLLSRAGITPSAESGVAQIAGLASHRRRRRAGTLVHRHAGRPWSRHAGSVRPSPRARRRRTLPIRAQSDVRRRNRRAARCCAVLGVRGFANLCGHICGVRTSFCDRAGGAAAPAHLRSRLRRLLSTRGPVVAAGTAEPRLTPALRPNAVGIGTHQLRNCATLRPLKRPPRRRPRR